MLAGMLGKVQQDESCPRLFFGLALFTYAWFLAFTCMASLIVTNTYCNQARLNGTRELTCSHNITACYDDHGWQCLEQTRLDGFREFLSLEFVWVACFVVYVLWRV